MQIPGENTKAVAAGCAIVVEPYKKKRAEGFRSDVAEL